MEKELRILKTISVGLQGRIYDRVYYIVDGKQRSRAYARPNDPETEAQMTCRDRMAALVKRWHALKGHKKNYWNVVAKLGGRKRTTGFNMFIRDGLLKASAGTNGTKKEGTKPAKRFVRKISIHAGNRKMNAILLNPPPCRAAPFGKGGRGDFIESHPARFDSAQRAETLRSEWNRFFPKYRLISYRVRKTGEPHTTAAVSLSSGIAC